MNTDPSAGPNFAQYQQDPLTTAQMPSGDPAASLPSLQPAITPASRGPALPLQPTGQPPSPFVQAFLTNAIFGGGSPPYPFGIGTGTRPGGQGGR